MTDTVSDLPLFLLNSVLLPEQRLPLKVFEPRYFDMVSSCLKQERPFGVCLIAAGEEVGKAAVPAPIGTLAHIEQWDMAQAGILFILVRGGARFEIQSQRVEGNRVIADVRLWPNEPAVPLPAELQELCTLLKRALEDTPGKAVPEPHRLDDASWVGMRLAQLLPVDNAQRQVWLAQQDPLVRLHDIRAALHGLRQAHDNGD